MPAEYIETECYVQSDWQKALKENAPDSKVFFELIEGEKKKNIELDVAKLQEEYSGEEIEVQKIRNDLLNVKIPQWEGDFVVLAPRFEFEQKVPQQFVDISESGNLGISPSSDGNVNVWNTDDNSTLRELKGHALDVEVARFFPSGMVVLSGGMDMTLRIWDVKTGDCVRTMTGHTRRVTGLDFIEKGAEVVSIGADGFVHKWLCSSGKSLKSYSIPDCELTSISWHEKDKTLLVASNKGHLKLLSTDLEEKMSIDYEHAISAAVSDNELIFAGLYDGLIVQFELDTKKVRSIYRTNRGQVHRMVMIGEGLVVSFANGSVVFYRNDWDKLAVVCMATGADLQSVYDFKIADGGDYLYTAGKDHYVRKYNVPDF
ncbi:unnamed protein product [Bursaphelenchus okinawaensis]|uniref:WD_REPEATS_REGION domain-containing protein n=1 Tax=Bursaphelenchus okinawaensis TaxID=465554 RepID=A0A811K5A3_9BILA|nr:unnamed protein product [Bursaphelenchus okinawaensis]CAG9091641.1 unnamed protein product [Bursaphelenchus okinawaensis]